MQDTYNVIKLKESYDKAFRNFSAASALVVVTFLVMGNAAYDLYNVDRDTGYRVLDSNAAGKCIGEQFSLMATQDNLQKHLSQKNITIDMDKSGQWLEDCMDYKQEAVEEVRQEAHNHFLATMIGFVASGLLSAGLMLDLRRKEDDFNTGLKNLDKAQRRIRSDIASGRQGPDFTPMG